MNNKIVFILLCFGFGLEICALAQISQVISYQGVVSDSKGQPKADGEYMMTFRLYDQEAASTSLWEEEKTITTRGGLFSTYLGDTIPFSNLAVTFQKQYWLGIQIMRNWN